MRQWLESKAHEAKYCDPKRSRAEWLSCVDGAKVFYDLFSDLTEQRVDYKGNKVEYGIALTEWIIEHDPEHLREIAVKIQEVLDRKKEYDTAQ